MPGKEKTIRPSEALTLETLPIIWIILPEVINIAVGVVTFFYIAVKLYIALKEL